MSVPVPIFMILIGRVSVIHNISYPVAPCIKPFFNVVICNAGVNITEAHSTRPFVLNLMLVVYDFLIIQMPYKRPAGV